MHLGFSRALSVLAGVTSVIFCLWFVAAVLLWDFQKTHDRYAKEILSEVRNAAHELISAIHSLNRLGYQDCNSETLVSMRREVFLSSSIKDIGFLSDRNLLCTTGLGILETPLPASSPDYVSDKGFEIWTNHPLALFDHQYTALIASKGSFNAIYDLNELNRIAVDPFRWQLVFMTSEKAIPVYGNGGTFQPDSKGGSRHFSFTTQYSDFCLQDFRYCVAVTTSWSEYFAVYQLLLIILSLFVITFGIVVSYLILQLFEHHHSTPTRVRRGIKTNQFYCHFQPVVNLATGQTIGCEALARFTDNAGQLYPDQFIPEVRKAGLTWEFTEQLIEKSLTELAKQPALPANFRVNFNLFPGDISSGNVRKLLNLPSIRETRFKLVFEVTEDEQLETKAAMSSLVWLNENGFLIAVDDFGTGYSNLNQIKRMQCQYLKIDRSFVMDMEEGSVKSSLIPHIVKIADELNLEVVAEGIENLIQEQQLKNIGVQLGQGWGFGKPMSADNLNESVR